MRDKLGLVGHVATPAGVFPRRDIAGALSCSASLHHGNELVTNLISLNVLIQWF